MFNCNVVCISLFVFANLFRVSRFDLYFAIWFVFRGSVRVSHFIWYFAICFYSPIHFVYDYYFVKWFVFRDLFSISRFDFYFAIWFAFRDFFFLFLRHMIYISQFRIVFYVIWFAYRDFALFFYVIWFAFRDLCSISRFDLNFAMSYPPTSLSALSLFSRLQLVLQIPIAETGWTSPTLRLYPCIQTVLFSFPFLTLSLPFSSSSRLCAHAPPFVTVL